jgi:hypothetical protein
MSMVGFGLKEQQKPGVIFAGEYPSSPSAARSANRMLSLGMVPESLIDDAISISAAENSKNYITPDSAKEMWAQAGLPAKSEYLENTTFDATKLRIENAKRQAIRQSVIGRAKSSTALSATMFAESLATQFVSPINVVSGFLSFGAIPIIARSFAGGMEARAAFNAGRATYAANIAEAGYAGRAGVGAFEGMAGNALTEVATNPLANYSGYDYSMMDSLMSIAMGAPFGAVLHTAPKAFRDLRKQYIKKRDDALLPKLDEKDFADYAEPGFVDSAPDNTPINYGNAVDDAGWADAADELRALGADVKYDAQTQEVPQKAESDPMDVTLDRTRQYAQGKLAQPKSDALNYPFVAELRKRGGVRVGSTLDAELRDRGITPNNHVGLFHNGKGLGDVDNFVAKEWKASDAPLDGNGFVDRQHILDGLAAEAAKNPFRPGDYVEQKMDEAVLLEQLDSAGIDIRSMTNAEVKAAMEVAKRIEANSADVKIYRTDPQTRLAAMTTAVSQTIDGRPINVEPVLALDPKYGEARPSNQEIADMYEPYIDEEGNAIDIDAEEMAASAKGDTLDETTEAAYAEASGLMEAPENMLEGGSLASDLVKDVRAAFGKHTDKLLSETKISVVQSVKDLPSTKPKLPKHLSGAKPRYKGFALEFDSDIDRAVYIVGDFKIDKTTGQPKRSKSHAEYVKFLQENGLSEKSARELVGEIKGRIKAAEKDAVDGKIKIADQSPDAAFSQESGLIKGVKYPDGRVYIVADNVTPKEVRGLVLHEIGVHTGMRAMLGDESFGRVLADVMESNDPRVAEARKAVPADTAPEHIAEETLAYLVQNAPESGIVKGIIAAIKAWLIRTFGARINIDELVARNLAFSSLKRVSRLGERGGEGTLFSKTGDRRRFDILPTEGRHPIVGELNKVRKFVNELSDGDYAYLAKQYGDVENGKFPHSVGITTEPQKLMDMWKSALNDAPKTEKTAIGEQTVIPGAEKITDKQLAERKMEQPLKAKKPQREMDVGLFGNDAKQTVLFSRGQKAPDKKQPELDLQLEKRVFDRALKDAEKYPEILVNAVKFANGQSDAGLRATLEDSAVTPSMVTAVMDELKKQHVRVQNELRRQKKRMNTEDAIDADKSFDQVVADRTAKEIIERIQAAKREAAFNFVARERAKILIRDYGSFADEGFLATLTGSSMLRDSARSHVAAYQSAYFKKWASGIEAALRKDGVFEVFTSKSVERDIARALEEMDFKTPDFKGLDADAVKIAKIMHRYQEATRLTLNKLGASIRYMPGYITRQSHDQLKIRGEGLAEWKKDAYKMFDLDSMYIKPKDADKVLGEIWSELASGTHLVEMPFEMKDGDFRSGVNLSKRVSQSRSIVFKKGAWFDYNAKYGTRDVAASYMRSIENSARVAGLMKTWGTNPEYNIGRAIDDMVEELRNSGDVDGADNLKNKRQKILNNLAVVDGSANIAGNVKGAQIASNIRLFTMMAKLGSSVFASVSDVPGYAANLRYEGRGNMFTGMAEAITGLARGSNSGVRAEVLKHLDVTFDHFAAETMQRLTRGAGFSQNLSASARIFTKLNLQQGWTGRLQKSAAYGFSNYLGDASGKGFAQLSDEMKRIFKIHGVDEAKWNVLRKATRSIDGKNYLVTDGIDELPDDVIAAYIKAKGRTVTPETIRNAREKIGDDFRAMVIDRAESAALSGDKRVEAAMIGNSRRGTVWGESIRFVGQFKSFPAMIIERILKREVYGRGYDALGDYMRYGKGDMIGLANILVLMTLTGYTSLTLKDAIKGKTPRPLTRPRTWTEAMAQGGFFGLAGDYMLNEYDSYSGRSFIANVAGPVFGGTINDLFSLKTALENGDKTAVRAVKLLQNNLPGANLFYVKPALDYLVMNSLMENMNPGYLNRSAKAGIKNTEQEWFFKPQSAF